ncbi:cullin associated and neddylation dissociated 1, partial [Chelydra serpentina]
LAPSASCGRFGFCSFPLLPPERGRSLRPVSPSGDEPAPPAAPALIPLPSRSAPPPGTQPPHPASAVPSSGRGGAGEAQKTPPTGTSNMASASYHISNLLEKMTSSDKDFRFMATNDLMTELQKDSIKLDDDSERKVVKMILKLLEDKNGEVQNLAVKWYVFFLQYKQLSNL